VHRESVNQRMVVYCLKPCSLYTRRMTYNPVRSNPDPLALILITPHMTKAVCDDDDSMIILGPIGLSELFKHYFKSLELNNTNLKSNLIYGKAKKVGTRK